LSDAESLSTKANQTVEDWLTDREAAAGLLPPPVPSRRYVPACVARLELGSYALDPDGWKVALNTYSDLVASERNVRVEEDPLIGELASAAGIPGGELVAAIEGRRAVDEVHLVALAHAAGVSVRSLVWRRRSGLQELP